MLGLNKVFKNNIFVVLIVSVLLYAAQASAFAPIPSQIIRFQPNMARARKPFVAKGSVTIGTKKIPTVLSWAAPSRYQLVLSPIPKNLYLSESGSEKWTLIRDGKTCMFKTESQIMSCPAANFWALIELGGSADLVAKALRQSKFIKEEDAAYRETDGKKEIEGHADKRQSHFAVGYNGSTPVSVLEIQGEDFQIDKNGAAYPLMQYDQKFLVPLLARNLFDGDLVVWKAGANLEIARDHKRFSHVISSLVEVSVGKDVLASFSRQNAVEGVKEPTFTSVKAPIDVSALKSTLSQDGQDLLKAIFYTH